MLSPLLVSPIASKNTLVVKTLTGHIEVIDGPMFSGKTTELIRRMVRYKLAGYRCVVLSNMIDTRKKEGIIKSHSGITLDAKECKHIFAISTELWLNYDVIGIDEGQFFNQELGTIARALAIHGKVVIIAGLNMDYNGKPFKVMSYLISTAERVDRLQAICMRCKRDASFTRRIGDSQEKIIIGGIESYEPVCRMCYAYYQLAK